ncbi:MAG: hypothetical protein ACYTEQ_31225 [Planctomycetota bacterium]|jgi:hypothetical protein
MHPPLNAKYFNMLPPQLKNDGDFATNNYADTSGGHFFTLILGMGDMDAAFGSVAETSPPLLEEADQSNFSDASDVSNSALSAAIADTKDNKLYLISYNLQRQTHKRYVRLKGPHAGAGTTGVYAYALGILTRLDVGPKDAAEMGLEEMVVA